MRRLLLTLAWAIGTGTASAQPSVAEQAPNTWVKRSPLPGGPRSPMLGYEATFGYDPVAKKIIRWAGHTQSGGHEQINETWTYDPASAEFRLLETNLAPPGTCCGQQNVFDPVGGRFLRFRSFSGSHGWHWFRENYLANSSVWDFDLPTRTWRNLRPVPEPSVSPLRCAAWDSHHHVVVVFGGEGNTEGTVVYDPYLNEWKRMNPKVQPAFRSGGTMAYDARRKRHILFGSQFSDDPHTWAYDLAANVWTDLKPKTLPPTDRNCAVIEYDARRDVVVASVQVWDAKGKEAETQARYETWLYDGDANDWRKASPNVEPPGGGNRRRILAYVPDLDVTVLENYVNPTQKVPGVDREQQMWTYRAPAPAKPLAPLDLPKPQRERPPLVRDAVVDVASATHVRLTWTPPGDPSVVGYHVERAAVDVFSEDQLHRLRKDTAPLSAPSVVGIRAIGEFVTLTPHPVAEPKFEDRAVDLAKPIGVEGKPLMTHRFAKEQIHAEGTPYRFAVFAYRIRSVNRDGKTSGPSPYFLTIPSAPEWVYSKEEGADCRLKWAKNPESSVVGYRVYRMESPRINGPGQKVTRVTETPVRENAYLDAKVGTTSARYWIVAVDRLGQEGVPSAPTWRHRFFKSHYDPFSGEWHQ